MSVLVSDISNSDQLCFVSGWRVGILTSMTSTSTTLRSLEKLSVTNADFRHQIVRQIYDFCLFYNHFRFLIPIKKKYVTETTLQNSNVNHLNQFIIKKIFQVRNDVKKYINIRYIHQDTYNTRTWLLSHIHILYINTYDTFIYIYYSKTKTNTYGLIY